MVELEKESPMNRLWNKLVNWFENGDLIPMLILISVPHYAQVLASYDWAIVGSVLGFLIDMGHYRTIKVFLNGKGAVWMIVLTLFSLGFHTAFYSLGGAGWWSLPIGSAVPAVIFALASINKAERLDKKAAASASSERKIVSQTQAEKVDSQVGKIPEMVIKDSQAEKVRSYQEFVVANSASNGNGHLTVRELVEKHGIPQSTAYRWIGKYQKEHGNQ